MELMPKFSVVMPVYNCEAYLATSIRSALQQDYAPQEIIVVDDGSTDRSAEIAGEFGDEIKFFQQSNQGCAAARNLGVRNSSGDYIAFLDSDDVWYPWALQMVGEAIRQHQSPAFVSTAMSHFSGPDPPEVPPSSSHDLKLDFYKDLFAYGKVVGTCILVVRRDVFDQAAGFVERNMNGTDAEFNLRAGTASGYVRLTHPPMLAYRQHDGNVTRSLEKSWEGQSYMIEQEKAQKYPGGLARQRDRIAFITTQTRPMSCRVAAQGLPRFALRIYRETFAWNFWLGRWKYLLGFPGLTFFSWLRRITG